MTNEEWDNQYELLCRRWARKQSVGQADIYYKYLQYFDLDRLRQAVANLMETGRMFPTPEEVKKAYYTIQEPEETREECKYCDHGSIRFSLNGKTYASPCGHCRSKAIAPLVRRMGDAIFYAYRRSSEVSQSGYEIYYAKPNNMERIEGGEVLTEMGKDAPGGEADPQWLFAPDGPTVA